MVTDMLATLHRRLADGEKTALPTRGRRSQE